MEFKAKKDKLLGVFFGLIIASGLIGIFLLLQVVDSDVPYANWIISFIIAVSLAFILWLWFGTKYHIHRHFISYQSGPIRGKIEIAKVNKIITNTTVWVGIKPALARGGLLIQYNKWDERYISPEDSSLFINELLKINPNIQVVDGK